VNDSQPGSADPWHKIATLVDHQRDGRFVVAFCPICDHAEEAEDGGGGHSQTQSLSIAKIKLHIRNRHPARSDTVKSKSRSFTAAGNAWT
jgi:hypothetical protein